ncbi:hypothetical protein [Povalibacter sp.]|uniref:hypothetical protein n=1 Tax=Povalibacter sp. TaxID=1962978 RepID=UPI002F420962
MNFSSRWMIAALAAAVAMVGCSKQQEPVAPASAPEPVVAAPAAPATTSAPPAAPVADAASPVNDERAAAIEAALAEEEIVSDARGQFAVGATGSSTYGDKAPDSQSSYTPFAATGVPNVEKYSDNGNSWATATPDKGIEWLEVTFGRPVQATQIRIRQNYNPGAIIKVELIAERGSKQTVWQGVDDQAYAPGTIGWFDRSFDKTTDKIKGARITLATNAVPGWNEIDAVQLLGD